MKPTYKRLTYEDRKKIEELCKKGEGPSFICKSLGKLSPQGVGDEIRRNGGFKDYNADEAQKKYTDNLKRNSKNSIRYFVEKQIELLQMQIDILSENVTKLMENK